MSRYIDADALLKDLCKVSAPTPSESWIVEKCIEKVNEQPTADVVEVVRCKDCKHLMFSDCYGECGKDRLGIVRPDDFCSRGERRGE